MIVVKRCIVVPAPSLQVGDILEIGAARGDETFSDWDCMLLIGYLDHDRKD